MDTFKLLVMILLSSVLVNNYVLSRFLGICPFLGVSKKLDQAAGMGVAVTLVMLLATAVTWPIQYLVLDKLGLGYLQNIIFILVIATLVQMLELVLKKFSPALYKGLGVYLPLITTNCAVLGVTINNIIDGYSFLESMADAAKSVVDYFKNEVVYINVMKNMSVDCDCCAVAEDPCIADIGMLASTDPVAIDKACLDLVYASDDAGKAHLIERIESRNGILTVDAAAKLGIGSKEYELVEI